jgi:prepilin-type processing-associated H-X9-DG protein
MNRYLLKPSRLRRAISLVELLVVIGIVGTLVSLALPAVMAARESSRRSQCWNNLKQLGLAVRNFENAFKKLPSSEPISLEGVPKPHGWLIYTMPYLEQQVLYDKYSFSKAWDDPANHQVVHVRLAMVECPATADPERQDLAAPPATTPFAAVSDYAAVTHVDPRLVTANLVEKAGLGAMPKRAQPRLDHIRDGASNTILLIESAGRPQVWRRGDLCESPPTTRTLGGAWASPLSDVALVGASEDGLTVPGSFAVNRLNGEPAGNVYPHPTYGTNGTGQFYSFHSGYVNAVFADGSVHSFSDDVDVRLMAQYVTRAAQETIRPLP